MNQILPSDTCTRVPDIPVKSTAYYYTHIVQKETKILATSYPYICSKWISNYTILTVIRKRKKNVKEQVWRKIFSKLLFVHIHQVKKVNFYSFFGAQYSAYKNVKDYSQIKHKLKLKMF